MKVPIYSWAVYLDRRSLPVVVTYLVTLLAGATPSMAFESMSFEAVDTLTGATPNALGIPPVSHRDRFQNPNCTSCHNDVHLSGFQSPSCTSCHGPIGAPKRPPELHDGNDHPDRSCTQCHEEVHADLLFDSPEDCRACHPYMRQGNSCTRTEDYDVVVIGGGGGGLAAAARLALQGVSVVLLEQHFRLGGSMNNFQRYDYRFETSLHVMPGYGFSYFDYLGLADVIIPIAKPLAYRAVFPDFTLDVPTNVGEYRELLKEQFPEDAKKINALFAGFNRMDFATYGGMTVIEALAYHGIDNEQLIAAFTLMVTFLAEGGIDTVPIEHFLPMWYIFHNSGFLYIQGGSQAIVDALEEVILDASGTIKRKARVKKIFVHANRVEGVQTKDGVCYTSRYVVSNANAKSTFLHLIGQKNLPPDMVQEIKERRPADSPAATLFLGVDRDYTDYFPTGTHSLYLWEDYGMNTEDWERLMCIPEKVGLIVENYTAADSSTAPPGKNVIAATAHLLNYECNDFWNWNNSYDDYNYYKSELATVLLNRLEAFLPDISEHIEVMEIASPQTIKHFTLNPKGTWAGWAYEPGMTVEYTDRIETPIDGLYMVGAWAVGAGQTAAIRSGIDAAEMIVADL